MAYMYNKYNRTSLVTYIGYFSFVNVFIWVFLQVFSKGVEQTAIDGACTNSMCEQKCYITLEAQLNYSCGCYIGFVLDEYGFDCIDIDECQSSSVCPVALIAGLCINTIGSYYCTCPAGFKFDENTWQCLDFDECSATMEYCDHICVNTLGSYECDCLYGYALNANTANCDDVDECDVDGNCDYQCRNTDGGFHCICPSGYALLPSGRNCTEFVEASFGLSPSVDNGFIWVKVPDGSDTLYPQFVCETRSNSLRFTELRVICRSVGLIPVRLLSSQTDREHLQLTDLDPVRFIGKNLVCDGDEENILQCFMDKLVGFECTSAQMVAIHCSSDEDTMLGLKSMKMPRSFALVRPFAHFMLNIGWMEQFHLANELTMKVACGQIGLEPFYLSGWISSSPKPNIECQSSDISSLDQCKFSVMMSRDFQVVCLQTVGFAEMTTLDRESESVVTFHVWTCAGAKVRFLTHNGVENKFLELQFNAFNAQNHSENAYISIWQCIRNESCSPCAQWFVGKIFSCRAPFMLQTSFWTTISLRFLSSNVLAIESSLRGHWENDALPEVRTSVNLTLPISHYMLPLIGFGNSNHEMMLKIYRNSGVNQCLMNPMTDNYVQCGDDFVNRSQCLRCGCCWIQAGCYFPRYSTYLGCFEGPDELNWKTSFELIADISKESDCIDHCRMEQFLYAAMQANYCFCGNQTYETQILCSNPSSAYALFNTLLPLMQRCYRDISFMTGEVLLIADSPRVVGEDVNLMVMIENYIPEKMSMELNWGDGSPSIPFSAAEVRPALSGNLPTFCLNANSLCGHIWPYHYSKDGSYDVMFKLQGMSAASSVRKNITLVALSSILLETYLERYGVVNNGPGLVYHPVTFVLYVKNPSPDMKVLFDPMDGTKTKEMKVKDVESVPDWVYRKTGFPDHMLRQFRWLMVMHVFAESGHWQIDVTINDSARDRYRGSVLIYSEVNVGLFDKYIGMVYLFNNGPVPMHNNVSLFFVIENITPKLYVGISASSTQRHQRLHLTKECDIPEFVQIQTAKRISVVELRAFYCSTINVSFNEPGLHEVEAYVGDPDLEKYSLENLTGFLRVKTVAKVLSLESFLGRVFLFNDGPVLQNLFLNFLLCIEKYNIIQNLELQVDFGDGNQSVANFIPNRINTHPEWAVALIKTSTSQVDSINKLYCMTMKHSYLVSNSSEYVTSVSISDKSSDFEADFVRVNTSAHVLSFEDAIGKTFLVPDELSMSHQMSGIWFFSEKFLNDCVLRMSPGDGTESKKVSVERNRNLPEWLQKQLKPNLLSVVNTKNYFVGILDHWYELAGLYVITAEILCHESLVWEGTAIANVSCYSQIDLSTGTQDKEKALKHVRKDGFRISVNVVQYCSSLPIRYSWSVAALHTDDASAFPSEEHTTSLPSSVSLTSQELVLPPHSLEAALYIIYVQVLFELHNSSFHVTGHSWVQFFDTPIVANIVGEYRRIAADITVPPEEQHFNLNYNWFCLRAGDTLPSGIATTDAVSIPPVGGCFGTGLKLKGFLPILEIHTKSLIYDSLPEDYIIYLFVKKVGLPVANVSVILSLRGAGGLPQVIITCISNCARQFNSSQALELSSQCINCIEREKLDLSWDISPLTDTCAIKQFDWAKYVIPQVSLDRLMIRPNTFTTAEENDVYKVTLTATRKRNTQVATGTRYISPKPIRISEEMQASHSD